jgi:hypothetical protein
MFGAKGINKSHTKTPTFIGLSNSNNIFWKVTSYNKDSFSKCLGMLLLGTIQVKNRSLGGNCIRPFSLKSVNSQAHFKKMTPLQKGMRKLKAQNF